LSGRSHCIRTLPRSLLRSNAKPLREHFTTFVLLAFSPQSALLHAPWRRVGWIFSSNARKEGVQGIKLKSNLHPILPRINPHLLEASCLHSAYIIKKDLRQFNASPYFTWWAVSGSNRGPTD